MEEVSEETCDMAFGLFDRYGRVERKYIKPGFRQGTGVWDRELDHGDILFIDKLRVESEARRRGVGTKLFKAVLNHVRGSAGPRKFVAVVGPGILRQDTDETDRDEAMGALATSRRFWRSLGFRRIGTSPWFAYTDQPGHPSKELDISKDWDSVQDTGSYTAISQHVQAALASVMSIRTPNAETLRQLERALPGSSEDERWFATDEEGNTVLHLAAKKGCLEIARHIVTSCPILSTARNREGETPLEAFESAMEQFRTNRGYHEMVEVISDLFLGFGPRDIALLGVLSGREVFNLNQLTREKISCISSATNERARQIHPEVDAIRDALRLKYGCTCGKCIGGFLSPRMRRMLLEQVAVQLDMDVYMVDDEDWIDRGHEILSIRFTECLEKEMIPSEDNIVSLVSDEEQHILATFLEEGGNVSCQVRTIFQRVLRGEHWARLLGNDPEVLERCYDLPECRNDLELGFVSGMCGYQGVSPGRQYYHDGLLDDEEEGEEEDDGF